MASLTFLVLQRLLIRKLSFTPLHFGSYSDNFCLSSSDLQSLTVVGFTTKTQVQMPGKIRRCSAPR